MKVPMHSTTGSIQNFPHALKRKGMALREKSGSYAINDGYIKKFDQ